MKKFKKLSAILLAMIMTMLVALPAMAANTDVTLTGDSKFTAYKIFNSEFVEGEAGAHILTIDAADSTNGGQAWFNTLFDAQGAPKSGEQKWFTARKAADYKESTHEIWEIILKTGTAGNTALDSPDSRAAAEWLQTKKPSLNLGNSTFDIDSGHKELTAGNGYYLFVSKAGTAGVALADDVNDINLTEKAKKDPTIDKKIIAVNGIECLETANKTVSVGDKVRFKITVTAPTSPTSGEDIVVTDTLDAGLTFVVVEITDAIGKEISATATDSVGTANVVTNNKKFTYTIPQSVIAANDVFEITYDATLVSVQGTNKYNNIATLKYNEVESKPAVATVYTTLDPEGDKNPDDKNKDIYKPWSLVKVDSENKVLTGAKFQVFKKVDNGAGQVDEIIKFTSDADTPATYTATSDGAVDTINLEANAHAKLKGLAGTIYLKEVKAPIGYNSLPNMVKVDLSQTTSGNIAEESAGTVAGVAGFPGVWTDNGDSTWVKNEGGLAIQNTTGATLPSTGGIGTTIFYVVGAILLLGAVVMLVVRRRMDK